MINPLDAFIGSSFKFQVSLFEENEISYFIFYFLDNISCSVHPIKQKYLIRNFQRLIFIIFLLTNIYKFLFTNYFQILIQWILQKKIFWKLFNPHYKFQIFNMCTSPLPRHSYQVWTLSQKLLNKVRVTQNTILKRWFKGLKGWRVSVNEILNFVTWQSTSSGSTFLNFRNSKMILSLYSLTSEPSQHY